LNKLQFFLPGCCLVNLQSFHFPELTDFRRALVFGGFFCSQRSRFSFSCTPVPPGVLFSTHPVAFSRVRSFAWPVSVLFRKGHCSLSPAYLPQYYLGAEVFFGQFLPLFGLWQSLPSSMKLDLTSPLRPFSHFGYPGPSFAPCPNTRPFSFLRPRFFLITLFDCAT